MKRALMVCAVVALALAVAGPAMACDGKTADGEYTGKCAKGAAKAAYDATLEKTGCEKTATAAYRNAMAETAYANNYAESGCSKSATEAAYKEVLADSGCKKSAASASQHAYAQTAYSETLEKTGCNNTNRHQHKPNPHHQQGMIIPMNFKSSIQKSDIHFGGDSGIHTSSCSAR